MAETLEIKLVDFREWLEQETVLIVEPLKAEGRKLLDEVKAKLDDLMESSNRLLDEAERKMNEGGRKTYRRAKVQYKLARNISEIIEQVTIPYELSQENLDTFCEELEKTLTKVGRERGRWFPVISPYFIMNRRRFDVALKRAMDSLEEMRFFSSDKYANAKTVEEAFSIVTKLYASLGELKAFESNKKRVEARVAALKKRITDNHQKIIAIQDQREIVELSQINEEIEGLEKEVKHSLRHLQKPFLKFQSLVQSSHYSLFLDETRKLSEYLSSPFKALATEDVGYPALKKILQKMNDAFAQKKLNLKKSRLKKARDQIDAILHKDTLFSLHQSCKEAFSKKQQLSISRAITESRSELVQLQKNLSNLEKRKELLDSRVALVEKKTKDTLGKIEDKKRELEKIVLELTDKKVEILL